MPEDGDLPADEKVRRSVARLIGRALVTLALLGVLGAWASLGFYELAPGQGAIVFRLGAYRHTAIEQGLQWHWPPPFERHEIVNVAEVQTQSFGGGASAAPPADASAALSSSVQTRDNNVVHVSFAVQYAIKDAFLARYRLADPAAVLRTAAEAAIREVVGRHGIDEVLSTGRAIVAPETQETLQVILDSYSSGLAISGVELQELQPPPEVQAAFDDVTSAQQDKSRLVNEAEAHRNEVLPRARGEAAEIESAAAGQRESAVAIAAGESGRFEALLAEYQKAPEVTRKRLYLETLEQVLPKVEKWIVEPGAAQLLPWVPLARGAREAPPGAGAGR